MNLNYDYGSSGSADDALSRIASLIDNDGTSHLADYLYLGQRAFVEVDYPEPELKYTLVGTAGGNDPDTGDIYLGLDRFGRVKDSMWYDYGSSADADRVKYGYDRAGNRTFREQTVDTNSNHDEFYQYDQIDRLKQMDRGTLGAQKDQISSLNFAQCWSLDPTGNWQGFKEDDDGDSSWDLEQTRTSNKVNEITDITETTGPAWQTPAYNRAGNMTTIPKPSDPTIAYTATYDPWNRLVKLEDGEDPVAEYRYDAAKRRIVKKTYTGGSLDETRHFFYTEPNKWQVIEERQESAGAMSTDPDRQFIWGQRYVDDLILRDRDTTDPPNGTLDERLYAQQDANWNVTSLSATDGAIQERYAYDAYGTPRILTPSFTTRATSNHAWEILYAGYRFEGETEMYQVRNRVLRPELGWVQRDPIGYAANDANLYRYVRSSPTMHVDPLGTLPPDGFPSCPELDPTLPDDMFQDRCNRCGLDITHRLVELETRITTEFNDLPFEEQASACNGMVSLNGWDIAQFFTADLGHFQGKGCGTGSCRLTVMVGGSCYYTADVNYYLWGLANRLCHEAGHGTETEIIVGEPLSPPFLI